MKNKILGSTIYLFIENMASKRYKLRYENIIVCMKTIIEKL